MLTIHVSFQDYKILCFVEMGNVGTSRCWWKCGSRSGRTPGLVRPDEMANAVLSMSMETVQTAAAAESSSA